MHQYQKGVVEFNCSKPALTRWLSLTTTASNSFEVAHMSPHIHHINTPLWIRSRLPTRTPSIALTLILRILEYPLSLVYELCKGSKFLLGNVVISKNFLRTRKIMVMHSNERESVVYIPL